MRADWYEPPKNLRKLSDFDPTKIRSQAEQDRLEDLFWAFFAHALVGIVFLIVAFIDYISGGKSWIP